MELSDRLFLDVVPGLAMGRLVVDLPDAREGRRTCILRTLARERAENLFLPAQYRIGESPADHGDLTGWLNAVYALGVDAVFSDFPAAAVNAR